MKSAVSLILLGLCLVAVCYQVESAANSGKRCVAPPLAPQRIEKIIGQCQEEIKLAILKETLQAIQENPSLVTKSRAKRQAFNDEEKKIAGCLLQCVYRKVKAVDQNGFPTVNGLVNLYTEGVSEREYVLVTIQAVQACLKRSYQKLYFSGYQQDESQACDVAFDVFECVTDSIGEYCGHQP